jgi:hypothetical protein
MESNQQIGKILVASLQPILIGLLD